MYDTYEFYQRYQIYLFKYVQVVSLSNLRSSCCMIGWTVNIHGMSYNKFILRCFYA